MYGRNVLDYSSHDTCETSQIKAAIALVKFQITAAVTGPRSAVGNVSGNRCESDCRSRGGEFDPSPVPYFRGDLS